MRFVSRKARRVSSEYTRRSSRLGRRDLKVRPLAICSFPIAEQWEEKRPGQLVYPRTGFLSRTGNIDRADVVPQEPAQDACRKSGFRQIDNRQRP